MIKVPLMNDKNAQFSRFLLREKKQQLYYVNNINGEESHNNGVNQKMFSYKSIDKFKPFKQIT